LRVDAHERSFSAAGASTRRPPVLDGDSFLAGAAPPDAEDGELAEACGQLGACHHAGFSGLFSTLHAN
jgi:hypothetical protein